MENSISPLLFLAPIVLTFLLADVVWCAICGKSVYSFWDTSVNLIIGAISIGAGSFFAWVNEDLEKLTIKYALFDVESEGLWVFLVCFVVDDFRSYWTHRISHLVRWCWADHSVHHSSRQYNLSTGVRLGFTFNLTPAFLTIIPMLLIGFPLWMILSLHSFNLIYQFLMHTDHVRKLPRPIEFLMNTPSNHRVHHGTQAQYIDKNFGCVFIIWDRMFGTYKEESLDDRPRYGLVQQLPKNSVIVAGINEWRSIASDLRLSNSVIKFLSVLFGRPSASVAKDEYAAGEHHPETYQ